MGCQSSVEVEITAKPSEKETTTLATVVPEKEPVSAVEAVAPLEEAV